MKSIISAALVLAICGSAHLNAAEKKAGKKNEKTVKVGSQAPDFKVKTSDGKSSTLPNSLQKAPCLFG